MERKILSFDDFLVESTISRPNYWEVNHPDKWQALQDLGFIDVTTDRMKKMGNNVILKNDEIPLYPSGIVYQDSGYLRDKSKNSGFIQSGKNWIQAADYLIEKFGLLKNNCPDGVPLQFVCFLLDLTDMKGAKKNTFKKLVFNVQNRTVSIFSSFNMPINSIEEFLTYGYTLDYVKNFHLFGMGNQSYLLTKEKCDSIFPKSCDQFVLRNGFIFSPDCRNVHLFPSFNKDAAVVIDGGINNLNCLSSDQPQKIEGLIFICPDLNSLSGLTISDAERVNIGETMIYNREGLIFPDKYKESGIQTTGWDYENWFKVLSEGTPKQRKLISTLPFLNADYFNEEIKKDFRKVLFMLGDLWDIPEFSEIQKGINLNDDQREQIEDISFLTKSGII